MSSGGVVKVGRGEGLQSYELGFPNFYARAVQFSKKWRNGYFFCISIVNS